MLIAAALFPAFTQAQLKPNSSWLEDLRGGFSDTFDTNQIIEQALPGQIGRAVQIVVGLAGVVMVAAIVYAGFLWLTAGGNTDNVEKAKKLLRNAIIGLIIVLLSYVLVVFVIAQLQSAIPPSGS